MQHPIYVTSMITQDKQEDFQRQIALLFGNELPPGTHVQRTDILHTRTFVHDKDEMQPIRNLRLWLESIEALYMRCCVFIREHPTTEGLYHSFKIPKKTGGLRTIQAPCEELKEIQRSIVSTLSYLPGVHKPFLHAHDTAFAYIVGRSTVDALKEHQMNGSNWFLKLDIKDFFPSCTMQDVLMKLLPQVYPLCYIPYHILPVLLTCCTLEGALPQGAASSPFLSNILMVPIDKAISDLTFNWNRRHIVYTRYADDLLFSARESFDWQELQRQVQAILTPNNFTLKQEKTRYGSRAGSNWNLGLMLNQTNQISLGYRNKQRIRAMLFNFLTDTKNQISWNLEDMQYLTGMLSYWRHIEPDYVQSVLDKYEQKTGTTYKQALSFNTLK